MINTSIFLCFLALLIATPSSAQSKTISTPAMNELHKRSLILLAKYNLTPVNKTPVYIEPKSISPLPLRRSYVLDTAGVHQLKSLSEKIGLNPSLYVGRRLIRLNYLLQDSSQANRSITAHILFADTNLAGAYLNIDGSYPGTVSLNDRSNFKPKNFTFPIFNLDRLDTVSLFGPWDKSDNGCNWINRIDLLSKEEIFYLVNTFSSGKKVNNELRYWVNDPIEVYALFIKLKTGEKFFPHFIFRNDTVYLDDYKCYYILDRKFKDFVKEIIKTKGISTCREKIVRPTK